MTVNNISTYGSLQTLLQNMAQSQSTLNNDEIQISSGDISQTFDGLPNNSINELVTVGAQVNRLNDYQNGNTTYLSQLNTQSTILGQIHTLATNVQALMTQQVSGTSESSTAFIQQLQNDLNTLTGQLNTSYAGSYLFGGTDTGTPPLPSTLPTPTSYGTPSNAYYQGSAQYTTVRISDSESITNSVTAGNPAFQNIIAGIQQAIHAAGTGDTAGLQNSETLVSNGLSAVGALTASVNSSITSVTAIQTQGQSLQTYFQGVTQSLTQSDVVALSAKVAQDQTVLEATFQTYSRVASLSMVNYLPNG